MKHEPAGMEWLDDVPPYSDADIPGSSVKPQAPKTNGHDQAAKPTYPLVWYGDITEPAHYKQVVDDLLTEGSFFVIYGESNSGKTFFIMDLALSVAQGIAWRGKGTRKGLVLYVAGEGAASVQNRVLAYRKTRPYVSDASPFAILPTAVDFMDPGCVHKLLATVKAAIDECGEKPALVIVDTLARAMSGEENSTQDMGLVVTAADLLRAETGACVGFVHHSGKDATRGARGSSALRAATDTEILVEGTQGPRTVTVMKQRDLPTGDKMVFELAVVEIGNQESGRAITSCTVNHLDESALPVFKPEAKGKNQRILVAALRARTESNGQRPITLTELRQMAKELGIPKSGAHLAVDALANSPFMTPFGGGFVFTDGDS
jgi:hypothetical protein